MTTSQTTMMAVSAQQKFNAAVEVIRGLPKNGSFQPSNEMMLKFYAYYKQATEGPCTAAKPGIWNMVQRKKWEAWSELGQMEKEAAMLRYVDELKNIVEMMPQTEQVSQFMDTLGSFYELVEEGVEASPVKELVKLPNGSAAADGREVTVNGHKDSADENGSTEDGDDDDDDDEVEDEEEVIKAEEKRGEISRRMDSGSDSEEFCDTSDQVEEAQMRNERLGLGSPTGLSFLPHSTEFSPRQLTESLYVNDTASSSNNLTLDASVQPETLEACTESDSQRVRQSPGTDLDLVACRGGGTELDQAQTQRGQRSGGSTSRSSAGGKEGNPTQGSSAGPRRGLFPSGSGGGGHRRGGERRRPEGNLEVQILLILLRLQQDLASISDRLAALELSVKVQREEREKRLMKESKWWPFQNLSKKMIILLLAWPVIAPFITSLIFRQRRRLPS